ncbi:MAG: YidC/Oxa1 family insertase periplasmic-domain containing protein [Phycisphaerae bacterium]
MQARQTLVALMVSMAVFYAAFFLFSRIWPPSAPTTRPAAEAGASRPSGGSTAQTRPAGEAFPTTGPAAEVVVIEGTAREPVALGGSDPKSPYPMLLEIDPRGADVTSAWIRGHYETVDRVKPYQILQPVDTVEGATAGHSFSTSVRFDHRRLTVPLADKVWTLDAAASTENRKVWTLRIELPGAAPLARVVKTYELSPQAPAAKTYDFKLSLRIENLSAEPARLIVTQRGSIGFKQEDPRYDDRYLIPGIRQGGSISTTKHMRADLLKAGDHSLGKDEGEQQVAWVADANKYFACIMAPIPPSGGTRPTISNVEAFTLTDRPEAPTASDMSFAFVTAPLSVDPGGAAELVFDCYLGPKSKTAFQKVAVYESRDYYAVMRAAYYLCAPAGLTGLMMGLLQVFHWVGAGNYGVAIIILVLVVRAILHPITKRAQVNMYKMQKNMARMAPKIEALKQKYANDRAAFNQAQMELWKEEGVNPAAGILSCLPMMLQVPIWAALWQALSSTIEMRHAPFDGWWIKDLAGPDALFSFSRGFDLPFISHYLSVGRVHSFNLLPFLLAVSQLLQMKYMPRATTGATTGPAADQMEQQRKIMMFMSVFFMVVLYNQPSGLLLYMMASNLFAVLEQWRIRKHLKELDEKKAAEPVAAGAASPGKPSGRRPGPTDQPRKPSWLERKWKEIQKQAEEARRIQSQRHRESK